MNAESGCAIPKFGANTRTLSDLKKFDSTRGPNFTFFSCKIINSDKRFNR